MQKGARYKGKIVTWLVVLAALVLLATVGITQVQKKSGQLPQVAIIADTTIRDNDSVEVVGIPTNDDPWKEVEKLVEAYYSTSGIAYKGTVSVIDDNGNKEKVIEKENFEYTILGNDYHYQLGDIEMVRKKDFLLSIDHANKTVSFAPQIQSGPQLQFFDIGQFRKIMLEQKANARVTQLGDEKILTIDNIVDPTIQGYRIYYSPGNYRVHKMLLGMARLQPLQNDDNNGKDDQDINAWYYYLDIQFSSIQTLSLNNKDFKPENKFIRITDGKIELTPFCKEYQLMGE